MAEKVELPQRFSGVELPRTYLNLPCMPASSQCEVELPQTRSNLPCCCVKVAKGSFLYLAPFGASELR